jgi:hypothetical protein
MDWIIVYDHLESKKIDQKQENQTVEFRLFDDDDILYFTGYMTQKLFDDDPFTPLDWAMDDSGCTSMKIKENGSWETL